MLPCFIFSQSIHTALHLPFLNCSILIPSCFILHVASETIYLAHFHPVTSIIVLLFSLFLLLFTYLNNHFYSLRISCIIQWNIITSTPHDPLSSSYVFPPTHSSLLSGLFVCVTTTKSSQVSVSTAWETYQGPHLQRVIISPQQLSTYSSFSVRDGAWGRLLPSMPDFFSGLSLPKSCSGNYRYHKLLVQ